MKTFRRLCAAFALTLALTLSAFAGDMTTGIAAAPPPPSNCQATTTGNTSTMLAGQMDTTITGEITTGVVATDTATEIALNLLQSVLSLF